MEIVICRACGYQDDIRTFHPALSAYNDIKCPKCGSTNNQHNTEYQRRMTGVLGGITQIENKEDEDGETD